MKYKVSFFMNAFLFSLTFGLAQVKVLEIEGANLKKDRVSGSLAIRVSSVEDFDRDGVPDLFLDGWVFRGPIDAAMRKTSSRGDFGLFARDGQENRQTGNLDGDNWPDIILQAGNALRVFLNHPDWSKKQTWFSDEHFSDGQPVARAIRMTNPNEIAGGMSVVERPGLPSLIYVGSYLTSSEGTTGYRLYEIETGPWLLSKEEFNFSEIGSAIPGRVISGRNQLQEYRPFLSITGGDLMGTGQINAAIETQNGSFISPGTWLIGDNAVAILKPQGQGEIKNNSAMVIEPDRSTITNFFNSAVLRDINDDGIDDLFYIFHTENLPARTSDDWTSILFGSTQLPDQIRPLSVGSGLPGVRFSRASTPPINHHRSLSLYDLNGDGKNDFAIYDPRGSDGRFLIHFYLSTAQAPSSGAISGLDIPGFLRVDITGQTTKAPTAFIAKDMVGDFHADLLVATEERVYIFDGQAFALGDERNFLPGLLLTTGFNSGIAVLNQNGQNAQVRFKAYDDLGRPVSVTAPVLLPSGKGQAKLVTEMFSAPYPEVLSVEVESDVTGVKAFALSFNGQGMDGAVALQNRATELIFPDLSGQMFLFNPNDAVTQVTLRARRNDGSLIAEVTRAINAKGAITQDIGTLFGTREKNGYVEASSTLPVVGVEMYGDATDFHTVNALRRLKDISGRGTIAHFAQTGPAGWYSNLRLINIYDFPVVVLVTAVSPAGGVLGFKHVTIGPRAQLVADVAELLGLSGSQSGYLTLEGNQAFLALLDFGMKSAPLRATVPMQTQGGRYLDFAHVAQGSGYYHGITVVNTAGSPNKLTVKVYNTAGLLTGEATTTLAAGEYRARLLSEWLGNPRFEQAGGRVELVAEKDIYSFSLFGDTGFGFLSAVLAQER